MSYRLKVATSAQRRKLYRWAWGLKGKGSISKIGKTMQKLARHKPKGYKFALNGLAEIGNSKKGFLAGRASCKRR